MRLSGAWTLGALLREKDAFVQDLESRSEVRSITFDSEAISAWDSGLVTSLMGVIRACEAHAIKVDQTGLPKGVQGLLQLAYTVPER